MLRYACATLNIHLQIFQPFGNKAAIVYIANYWHPCSCYLANFLSYSHNHMHTSSAKRKYWPKRPAWQHLLELIRKGKQSTQLNVSHSGFQMLLKGGNACVAHIVMAGNSAQVSDLQHSQQPYYHKSSVIFEKKCKPNRAITNYFLNLAEHNLPPGMCQCGDHIWSGHFCPEGLQHCVPDPFAAPWDLDRSSGSQEVHHKALGSSSYAHTNMCTPAIPLHPSGFGQCPKQSLH